MFFFTGKYTISITGKYTISITFRLPDFVAFVDSTSRGRARLEETRRKPKKSILVVF